MGRSAPLYEKQAELVKRDVHGRVRHAWAREAAVHNADPVHCKGVWKPPPDKHVNKTSGLGLAGAVQRARRGGGRQPKEPTPEGVGRCDRIGHQHQANLREMRELERRKADEPRPATVPAMHVAQAYHVQQFLDRAAHHGELAMGARTERIAEMKRRHKQGAPDPWGDMGSPRPGHTQHRTAMDVDARIDDVWGAFHKGRGAKPGQLAGSNYVSRPAPAVQRVYIGNLSLKAGLDEVKERIGLRKKEYLLCDPSTAEDNGVYWMERKPGANFCVMCTRDKSLAQRIVNYCKGRRCDLHGKQLRVDLQHRGDCNMQWTKGHAPEAGDWTCDSKQISKGAGQSYKLNQTGYQRDFSGGLQYDVQDCARYLKKHPAGSKTYPSVAEGGRRGAAKNGLVLWHPWMPAWEKGAPLKMMQWLPTPSFPGGGEVDLPMGNERMRLKYRRPEEFDGAQNLCRDEE
jgi:hypothetical protein